MKQIVCIVSGGQTGVDRAAFDFALENRIEISGFIPKNRRSEDGEIPSKYPNLRETETEDYAVRTELNVVYSDATLILSHGALTGGSRLTAQIAEQYEKPFLHVDFSESILEQAVEKTKKWLASIDCGVLNIAGQRASEDTKIYDETITFLEKLFN